MEMLSVAAWMPPRAPFHCFVAAMSVCGFSGDGLQEDIP
jgi:hypothetical protein